MAQPEIPCIRARGASPRSVRLLRAFAAGSLLLLAAGCLAPAATSEDAENRRGTGPQTGKTRAAGGPEIAYTLSGEGETMLVLVHGWGASQAIWASQVDDLAQRYTVLTVDLRGHGASGGGSGGLGDLARDVGAAMAAVGASRAILVGHQLGGLVALEAARERPQAIAGLIGIESFPEQPLPSGEWNELLGRLEADFPGACRSYVRGLFAMTTEEPLVDDAAEQLCRIDEDLGTRLLRDEAAYDLGKGLASLPAQLPVRSILSTQELEPPAPPLPEPLRRFHAAFGTTVIARSGQFPMLEQSAELTRHLAAALKAIEGN